MRQQVCDRLRTSVNSWQINLQARCGDPRVYEAEREERERQDERVAYDLSRRNGALLEDAYAAQATKNRESHSKRIKLRLGRSASKPPQSAAAPQRSRK